MSEDTPEKLQKAALPENAGRLLISLLKRKQIGPIFVREEIVNKIDHQLRNKQHAILVGEPGTGKTACVEALATKWLPLVDPYGNQNEGSLFELKEDRSLPYRDILEVTYSKIIEGCFYSGNIENKISMLFDNCAKENLLLFFDNIHLSLIPNTGNPEDNVFNFLMDCLPKDNRVVLLASTTPEGYKSLTTIYPAKAYKFIKIEIPETNPEETFRILVGIKELLEAKYRVKLTDDALRELIEQFGRFLHWRKFPGKAFESLERVIQHKRRRSQEDPLLITPEDVKETLIEEVGLNQILVDREKPVSRDSLISHFSQKIFEQEEAVGEVADAILRFRMQATVPKKPVASFLFAGPSGVGKTELAKVLAGYLFGSEQKLFNYSMSLYLGISGVERLLGGRKGLAWEEGRLLRDVSSSPFSVILLDEIDQASETVINSLYQILDEGRLVDDRGVETPFYSSIIIATTNFGCELFYMKQHKAGFKTPSEEEPAYQAIVKSNIIKALRDRFGDPFLNRFSAIVSFHPLSQEAVKKIALSNIERVANLPGIKEKRIIPTVSDDLLNLLTKEGYDPSMGARAMERTVTRYVLNPLVAYLSQNPQTTATALMLNLEGQTIVVKKQGL